MPCVLPDAIASTVIDTIDQRIEICQYEPMVDETMVDVQPLPMCCAPLVENTIDEAEAGELAALFKVLGDPVRLRLVSMIATAPSGELCACDLPELFDRSQPTMSHHLGQLTKAGLISREQRGKWAWFRIVPDRLDALATVLGTTSAG